MILPCCTRVLQCLPLFQVFPLVPGWASPVLNRPKTLFYGGFIPEEEIDLNFPAGPARSVRPRCPAVDGLSRLSCLKTPVAVFQFGAPISKRFRRLTCSQSLRRCRLQIPSDPPSSSFAGVLASKSAPFCARAVVRRRKLTETPSYLTHPGSAFSRNVEHPLSSARSFASLPASARVPFSSAEVSFPAREDSRAR